MTMEGARNLIDTIEIPSGTLTYINKTEVWKEVSAYCVGAIALIALAVVLICLIRLVHKYQIRRLEVEAESRITQGAKSEEEFTKRQEEQSKYMKDMVGMGYEQVYVPGNTSPIWRKAEKGGKSS